jgi:hypothetical protein
VVNEFKSNPVLKERVMKGEIVLEEHLSTALNNSLWDACSSYKLPSLLSAAGRRPIELEPGYCET